MADEFAGHAATLSTPGERHYAVTPSPAALDPRPRSLFIGVGGTITVEDAGGVVVVYTVQDGAVMPFRAVKVTAATASGIVAWY